MTFRLAKDDDFEVIYRIWQDGLNITFPQLEYSSSIKDCFLDNFLNRNQSFNFWVAEDATIVGWCSVLPMFSHPLKRFNHAEVSIYVSLTHIQLGIGQLLLQHVFESITNSSIKTIYAFANTTNTCSIHTCKKAGMVICGKTKFKTILIKEHL